KRRSSQRFGRPATHRRHCPHGAELAATIRSPSFTPGAPRPAAVTTPASSCPNTVGTCGIITGWPRRKVLTSVPQVSAASTRTTRPPGSGSGTGASSKRRSPGPWKTWARMLGRDVDLHRLVPPHQLDAFAETAERQAVADEAVDAHPALHEQVEGPGQ